MEIRGAGQAGERNGSRKKRKHKSRGRHWGQGAPWGLGSGAAPPGWPAGGQHRPRALSNREEPALSGSPGLGCIGAGLWTILVPHIFSVGVSIPSNDSVSFIEVTCFRFKGSIFSK